MSAIYVPNTVLGTSKTEMSKTQSLPECLQVSGGDRLTKNKISNGNLRGKKQRKEL